MTNEIQVGNWEVPEWARVTAPEVLDDFGEVGGLPTISTVQGGAAFLMRKDGEEIMLPNQIPIVILGISPRGNAKSRAWYAHGYVPGQADPPDCSSSDGVAPDGGDNRQSPTCAQCPLSAFGSNPVTGRGQACSQHKTLFFHLVFQGYETEVFQTRVSPTSLKNFAVYGKELKQHGVDKSATISIMTYEPPTPDRQYQVLKFLKGPFLPKENALLAMEKAKSPEIQGRITDDPAMLPAPPVRESLPTPPPPPPAPPTPAAAAPPTPAPAADREALEAQKRAEFEAWKASKQEQMNNLVIPTGGDLDAVGMPWDARIHSSGKTKVKDGTWKKKKGVPPEEVAKVEAELRSLSRPAAPEEPAKSAPEPPPAPPAVEEGGDLASILSQWAEKAR